MNPGRKMTWYCLCTDLASGGMYTDDDRCVDAALRHWRKHHVGGGEQNTYEAMHDIGPRIITKQDTIRRLATLLGEDWDGFDEPQEAAS